MKYVLTICALLAATTITASASVDRGLLSLAPSNSQLLVGIDVQKTRSSELGQYMLSKSQTDDLHLQQFIDKTAFDPRRDLQSLLLVAVANSGTGKGPASFAVLARGVFDQAKIVAAARTKEGVAQTFDGVTMTIYPNKGQSIALAFPEIGVAVMADLSTMQQIITNRATPTSFDPDLTARINAVGGSNDAWFVSTTGPAGWKHAIPSDLGGSASGQAQALQSIRSASGGMKSGATVDFSFDATARSVADATSLADVFRFMASAVQMQRQQDPRVGLLAASLDNMLLSTAGSTVHISFSIPEKSLEQLADLGPPAHVIQKQ